jgi:hypothetical protein
MAGTQLILDTDRLPGGNSNRNNGRNIGCNAFG